MIHILVLILIMLLVMLLINFPIYTFFYLTVCTGIFLFMKTEYSGEKDLDYRSLITIIWLLSPIAVWWSL